MSKIFNIHNFPFQKYSLKIKLAHTIIKIGQRKKSHFLRVFNKIQFFTSPPLFMITDITEILLFGFIEHFEGEK